MPAEGAWPKDGELIVGLVGPIGVDLELVTTSLEEQLTRLAYATTRIRLTDTLVKSDIPGPEVPSEPLDARYHALMERGNTLCATVGQPDAMAALGIGEIIAARRKLVA